jgi:DNA end-binding protein Ku
VPRVVWKGAITFGLVYIPVSLYPGSRPAQLDFDLLDKRDFAPIGYRRVNKRTGEEVAPEDTVRGYQYEEGEYVVMSDEDFRQANVKATQTVEIQAFLAADEIPAYHFDTPYYLEPGKRGEKGYVLLRETLQRSGRVGLAQVVLHTRQHLAVVMPFERLLVLNTLRHADELRPASELTLPEEDPKTAGVTQRELDMAAKLVADMTERWDPKRHRDTYRDDLLARIERKVKRGETRLVTSPEDGEPPRESAQIIDLMAALKASLGKRPDRAGAKRTRAASRRTDSRTAREARRAAPRRKRA